MKIQNIPISEIRPGQNDRQVFAGIEELASSIQKDGLSQPITVRPIQDSLYEIVAGERRYRAIKSLGWKEIPSIVRELTNEQTSAIMLSENTARANLNPIEEANAYEKRRQAFGWSLKQISQTAGVSKDRIKRRLLLLKLTPDIQRLVAKRHFPIGYAELIAPLDANRQRLALRAFIKSKKRLTKADFSDLVNVLFSEQSRLSLFDIDLWVAQNVTINKKGKKAKVGVPTRDDLPVVKFEMTDNVASVINNYIKTLSQGGFDSEAATIGTLFKSLIQSNYMRLPKEKPCNTQSIPLDTAV